MVDVSVSNKPSFIVCQWADCKVIKVDLLKEKHKWLTHHIVSVSFCTLTAGLALIYSKGGDIKAEKSDFNYNGDFSAPWGFWGWGLLCDFWFPGKYIFLCHCWDVLGKCSQKEKCRMEWCLTSLTTGVRTDKIFERNNKERNRLQTNILQAFKTSPNHRICLKMWWLQFSFYGVSSCQER